MKITIALSLLTFSALTAVDLSAESVTLTEPGTLAGHLAGSTGITTLEITGPVNAADFDFINRKLPALTSLNLANARIEPYDGTAVLSGRSSYPADQLPAYALSGTRIKTLTLPSSITSIGPGALAASAVTSFSIPAGVTSIGAGALSGCASLTELTLPATVASLDSLAFAGCTSLKTVTFAMPQVPAGTFKGCSSLATFNATEPLTSIGNNAFQGCVSLREFRFDPSLKMIGDGAFLHSGLEKADMTAASRMTGIGAWAFSGCDNLTEVATNDALTTIGHGAFFGDRNLRSIRIPSHLTDISDFLFTGDSMLAESDLMSQDTRTVGRYAYKGLESMTTIYLSPKLESIGDNAMEGCLSLDTIHAESVAAVPALGRDVWKDVDQSSASLIVSNGMESDFKAADQWKEFQISVPSSIGYIDSDNRGDAAGVTARFEGKDLVITANEPICNVALTGINATTLYRSDAGSVRVVIDTSRWSDQVYLLQVSLEGGAKTTLKLAR